MARSRRASPGPFFRLGGGGGASCVGSTPSRNALMKTPSPRPHRAKFIFTPRQDLHAQIGMKKVYAEVLCCDVGATLDTLREAVTTLEEIERTARQVLGGAHPTTEGIEATLRRARVILQAREARSA